jgi:colanic acid biosynthesis glycosyl transferase WcaI
LRILIYGLNFFPEITGVGKYTSEMAAHLAGQGHQIKVITSHPYYPQWKISREYQGWKYTKEDWALKDKSSPNASANGIEKTVHSAKTKIGIEVYRCPLWVPANPSGLKRIIHLLSFAFSSLPICLSQVLWKPDLVFCIAPTILTAPTGLLTASLCGSKTWLHIQDFEIGAAWSLGFLTPQSILHNLVDKLFHAIIKRFDLVSTISNKMVDHLIDAGLSKNKTVLFPNWVDTSLIYFNSESNHYRKLFNITRQEKVVLFSGSMNWKQGLPIVIEAARALTSKENIHFILCGEGQSRQELERQAAGLPNVHFLPLQPIEMLNQLLNTADIHLLPQLAASADLVMPSKITAILASGRPVIATANSGTEIGDLIHQAGLLIPPENSAALAEGISYLADHPEICKKMGLQARKIAESQLSCLKILTNLDSSICSLLKRKENNY